MANEIEQQLMWCNRARMILGTTGGKEQRAVKKFDQELAKVRIKLGRLIEMAGESTPVVQGFIEQLDQISVKASGLADVADPRYKGTSGQKTLRNEAKAITAQLETLGKAIEASKPAKEILEARERFFSNTARTRKRLKELGSQEKSDSTEVQELLAFIENAEQLVRTEVAYQQPAECDKATRVISEWLNQLSLKLENRAKGERKLDEAQSRAKPLVEDRTGAARRVLAEGLTSGQLTPELQRKLEESLRAIELKGASGLWTEALTLCKSLPTAAECKKAYLLTKRSLTSNFGDELRQCESALNGLVPVLESSLMEIERAKYNQLIAQGGAEGLSTSKVTKLRGEMMKAIEGWTTLATTQTEEGRLLAADIASLQERIERRKDLVPLPQAAENGRQFELVDSLHKQLLFTAGRQAAATLGRQLTAQRPAVSAGNSWGRRVDGVSQLSSSLDNWSKAQNLAPTLRAEALRLSKLLSPDNTQLTSVRDWPALLQAHKQAQDFLKSASKNSDKFIDFEPERKPLDDAMGREWAKVEKAFEDFVTIAGKAAIEPEPVLYKLRAEYAALRQDWEDWLANTTRESKTKIKAVKAGVAALLLKIDGLDDAEALETEGARQAEDKGRERFITAKAVFESTQLAELFVVDALKGEQMRKLLEALVLDKKMDEPGKPWVKRIERVAAMVIEATQATLDSRGRLQRKNETLVRSVASQKQRLVSFREAMKTKKLDVKKFDPLLKVLDADLANLELLTTTGNVTAADVNNRLLAEFDRRVEKLQLLVTNSSTFDDYTSTLERDEEAIGKLKDNGLDEVAPETMKALKEQVATLKADLFGMDPEPAAKAMRAMALAISDAGKELADTRLLQNQATLAANDCLRRVAAFGKTGVAETYRKSLESRIAATRERAGTASELPAALKDFTAIQDELTEIEANPDAAYTRQKNVLAEQHATLKLKREWEGRLSVVNGSVLTRLNNALKKGGDKSQKAEVERMIAMAEKAVKDNKDYERGLRLLTQVEGRVAQIERNPEGTGLGDRKALPKHVDGYATNVVKLRQSLETFVTRSLDKVKSPERKTQLQTALRKQVDPLTLQLNPGLFAAPLKILLDDKLTDAQRREAREQALSRLREAVGFITGHPTMVKLAGNPIVPLQPDMRALDASLTRLEAHLRASVR